MQENLIRSEPLTGIAVGRESEEMCLLAKFFNGFANSTRLSILLLLAQRDEMKVGELVRELGADRKSTRLNSSHANISYAVFCLKKKKKRTGHADIALA